MAGRTAEGVAGRFLVARRGVAASLLRSGAERCTRRGRPRAPGGRAREVVGRSMTVQRDTGFRNGIDVRVRLRRDGTSGEAAFDGAWWPRSRLLSVELPELVAALDKLGVRVER